MSSTRKLRSKSSLTIESLERRECLTASVEHVANINTVSPFVEVRNTAAAGGNFYLLAAQKGSPLQLWRSSGTTESTIALTDLSRASSIDMANVSGVLYFVGSSPSTGQELWRTDGTVAGTRLVKDLTPGTGNSDIANMFAFGSQLYFRNHGDLCVSDGTSAGTKRVADVVPNGNDNVREFTRVNSLLYFTAGSSFNDVGLYKTDGETVTPIAALPRGSISDLELVGSNLFFRYNSALWKLDTTSDRSVQVADVNAFNLAELNGGLIFSTGFQLWKSDGTAAGTREIGLVDFPGDFYNHQGILYFNAGSSASIDGVELWRSDGTASGTFLLKDIDPDFDYFGQGASSYPDNFTNFNGQLVFTTHSTTRGLWTTDGTAAGTVPIVTGQVGVPQVAGNRLWVVRSAETGPNKQLLRYTSGASRPVVIDPPGVDQGSSVPGPLLELNGKYYMFADDGVVGRELFRLNADNSLSLVKDVMPGPASSSVRQFTKANGLLYFTVRNARRTNSYDMYSSDGTSAGTILLMEDMAVASPMVPLGNQLFFAGDNRVTGTELWKTDGTVAGTVLVKDISPDVRYGYVADSSYPYNLTVLNGTLYFGAHDGTERELWKSDGTTAGTKLAVDVYPGANKDAEVAGITLYQGQMYFMARNGTGWQLFRSNGTAAGTVAVSSTFQSIGDLAVASGSLYFSAKTASAGEELWKVTGNARPVMVRDIRPGSGSSSPKQLRAANGKLYFVADDGIHGAELWQTNGTAAGTVMVRDTRPGATSSDPHIMRAMNGVLFFAADDGDHGVELWQTNGALSGASLVADLNPGVGSSFPAAASPRGDELLFRAFNPSIGTELLRVRSAAPVMTLPVSAPQAYTGNGPVRLAPQATLLDSDSPIMLGAQLTVSLGNTYRTHDQLVIAPSGAVSIQQSRVLVSGVVVGVITYSNSGRDLNVLFNQNATRDRVRAVLRSVAFTSRSPQPIASTRIVRFDLTDGDGGQASHRAVRIVVE